MNLAIVGAGNMGLTMYHSLATTFGPENVWLCDSHEEKLKSVAQATTNLSSILPEVEVVIFAIKPQSFSDWKISLPKHLIISIMTGVTLKTLAEKTGSTKIVRSMPNLALKLGSSLTGWIATKHVKEKEFLHTLFSSFGKEFEVEEEEQLDSLTALSGSGPAYFLYFCEELFKKAEAFGFSEKEAKEISLETLKAAFKLLEHSSGEAQTLINAITSKGGTTHAALTTLKEGKAGETFSKAIDAARNRAEELSLGNSG